MNICETIKKFKKLNFGHNNMTFTIVEQKIACAYIETYLRYSNFA